MFNCVMKDTENAAEPNERKNQPRVFKEMRDSCYKFTCFILTVI